MDTEAWIALTAVVISVAAAITSIRQASTAMASAKAAKDQAAAAKEANQLTRQQMFEQAAKEQQAAAEAEQAAQREGAHRADVKVHIELSGNGGSLAVQITNHGLRAVTDVHLVDVTPQEAGPWRSWKPNPNVGRQLSTTSWPLLHAGSDVTAALWLLDENGTHIPRLPGKAAVEIRFRDGDGQWWSAVTGRTATRINPPPTT
jgi:hypothetical protein